MDTYTTCASCAGLSRACTTRECVRACVCARAYTHARESVCVLNVYTIHNVMMYSQYCIHTCIHVCMCVYNTVNT